MFGFKQRQIENLKYVNDQLQKANSLLEIKSQDNTRTTKKQIELLSIVATGCRKHASYRGVRDPKNCDICHKVFRATTDLTQLGVVLRPPRKSKTRIKKLVPVTSAEL